MPVQQLGLPPARPAEAVSKGYVDARTLSGVVVLGADVTGSTLLNTLTTVTGLSFLVAAAGSYYFRACVQFTVNATSTGTRWTLTGPATTTLRYRSEWSTSSTGQAVNEGLTAYGGPSSTSSTSAATGANIARLEGFLTASAAGTVSVQFAAGVASSAVTARAGSLLEWRQTA